MDRNIWAPTVETISSEELFEKIEKPKLKRQISQILDTSLFYQNKFKEIGKSTNDITHNFEHLPFTEKHEILEDQINYPPFGSNLAVDHKQIVRVHRTSGSTGRPIFIALTRNDIKAIIDTGVKCFWASGLRPEDIVFNCLNYCMWMGGFTDHQSLEATGAVVVPFGVGNSKDLITSLLTIKATALHCTPSYISNLELLLKDEFGISPMELGIRKGLFAGEGGLQDPKFRKKIEDIWGIKAFNANYGLADVHSIFGAECLKQKGLHFMGQGNLFVELIDPVSGDKLDIKKGNIGEFVLTNLERDAQPLIRFRSRDIVEILDHSKCSCGRTSFRFNVLGRSDDMITVKGINIFPGSIKNIISEFFEYTTGEYQIIVEKKQPIDKIQLLVEGHTGMAKDIIEQIQGIISQRLKEKLFVKTEIKLITDKRLPRTDGKTKRVIWV